MSLGVFFGSKNVERILLFLLVNERCYPTQLHRHLSTPLTPLQQTFSRLEKGGLLTSYYEGKTRYYQFNPLFPLLEELELMLKKAYGLLSLQEKKVYTVVPPEVSGKRNRCKKEVLSPQQMVKDLWHRLSQVKHVAFTPKSKALGKSASKGVGKGIVKVEASGSSALIFHEHGSWSVEAGQEFDFSNIFRWTLDPSHEMISLEHLRYGPNQPVFLFHLIPTNSELFESLNPHLCHKDTYFGTLRKDRLFLQLNCRIVGTQKNEEINYLYTA